MKIIWTQHALDDLQAIREYLKHSESPAFAKRVTKEILDELESPKQWRDKGVVVPELEDLQLSDYRQLLAGQHRIIIVRGTGDHCYVQLIAHTSRDLEALLRRRLLAP